MVKPCKTDILVGNRRADWLALHWLVDSKYPTCTRYIYIYSIYTQEINLSIYLCISLSAIYRIPSSCLIWCPWIIGVIWTLSDQRWRDLLQYCSGRTFQPEAIIMANGVFKSCWCFHIGLYLKKPCPIYIILVYTTFPPYFIMPCDVQLYLPQIIPSCAYFPYHTSSYHHTGPGILYVFEGTSKPVLFCIYKSLLTHIPFMDACFAKFNREIQRKIMIVVVGQCNVSTQAPGGEGGGRASPKKHQKQTEW